MELTKKYPENMVLPFKEPRITSYPFHANILAMFEAHDEKEEKMLPWVYSYYIQLHASKGLMSASDLMETVDFCVGVPNGHIKNCPWLVYHGMDRKLINKKWSSFCEFAIDCINVGYYIYLNLDYYYLPISTSYQKRHFAHDIIIYGYDMNTKMFNVADFFENSAYAFKEAKFDDIENAYINYDDKGILEGRRSSILLKVNKENHINKTIFDVDLVKVLISDYLAGANSNYRYRFIARNINDSQTYGLDIYNVIESHLNLVKHKQKNNDIRPLHVLYDHKRIMRFLIDYMGRRYLLKNACYYYDEIICIEKDALTVRNLCLKFNLSDNAKNIERAIEILKSIKSREEVLFRRMLEDINDIPKLYIPTENKINKSYIDFESEWKSIDWRDMITDSAGASVKTAFFGNEICLFAESQNSSGSLSVYIDGEYDSNIDLNGLQNNNQEIYKKGLSDGYHVVKVKLNSEPTSKIMFSHFEVEKSKAKNTDNKAQFISTDTETKGNWRGKYGFDGYYIAGETDNMRPSYMQYVHSGMYTWNWETGNLDDKALQKINGDDRIASCLVHDEEIIIDIVTGGEIDRKFSIYLLDWSRGDREISIKCIDGDTDKLLNEHIIQECTEGIYVNYYIKGHIMFKLTKLSGTNAIFSGLFWGNPI